MLEGDAIHAFKFMREYSLKYAKLPSYQLIHESTGIDLLRGVNTQESSKFFFDKLKERYYWTKSRISLLEVAQLLEEQKSLDDIRSSLAKILMHDLHDDDRSDLVPRSIFSNSQELLDDYEKAKLYGITGIPTPWPSMNKMTMGFQKEDFVLFASRPGTGKTWLLIILLMHAWQQGHRVLLFSTEMSLLALKRRTMALVSGLSYGYIKAGRLTQNQYQHYIDMLKNFEKDDRFLVNGNDTTLLRSTIEQSIMLHKPDLVGIDGYYMVRDDVESPSKDEIKMGAIWKTGKALAKKYGIPFLVTHQLNRPPQNQRPGQKPDLSRLSYSDASGQYADYVFSIWCTEEMKNDKRLGILPLKTRDSEHQEAIEIRWDLSQGLFMEIDKNAITTEMSEAELKSFLEPSDTPL
jgi:replicative DNA helicase